MSRFILLSIAILAFVGMASAEIPMGAASFGWPPPRIWDDAAENNAPCGSLEDPSDRTNFTYYKGHVLLFTQAKAWNLRLGVSYYSHPKTKAHFQPIMKYVSIAELDAGITCINVPDAPGVVKAGHPATLQLTYVTDHGSPSGNITFYACADITYVSPSDIPYQVPCFNTTEPKDHYAIPPARPKLSPTKDFPQAAAESVTSDEADHGMPKWLVPVAAVGGAFKPEFFGLHKTAGKCMSSRTLVVAKVETLEGEWYWKRA
ncbi:hypothetical protein GGI35DRAFT_474735 [Trichoderma velutinum]